MNLCIFAEMIKKPLPVYAGIVFITGFVIMWVFRSHQQFADGLSNALSAKQGKDLFNPHDMILPSVVHILYKVALIFSKQADVLDIAAFHNTFYAAIILVCVFLLSFKVTKHFLPAAVVVLGLMVTGGFWLFVPLVEVYIPAQAWLAAATVLLVCYSDDIFNNGKWYLISVCIICSALYHQTGVLFIIPFLAFTWVSTYIGKWKTYLKAVAVSAAVLLGIYIVVYVVSFHTFSIVGFYKYCFSYYYSLKGINPDWGTFHNFSKGGLLKFSESITAGIFTANPGTQIDISWVYGMLWGVLVLGMFVFSIFNKGAFKGMLLVVSTWLLSYSIFIIWWTPGFEFISLLLFPFWILVLFILHKLAGLFSNWLIPYVTETTFTFMLVAYLLIYNLPVFTEYRNGENIGLRESKRYNALVGKKGIIITNYNTQTYLRYYFDHFNNIENVQYLGSFYNHDTLPTKFRPSAHEQIAIAFWHFGPWYNWNGVDGWQKPCEWKAFCHSIMDIKYIRGNLSTYSARKCSLYKGTQKDDDAFLIFDTARYYFNDPATPFKDIDTLLIKNNMGKDAVLKQWYDKHGAINCK